MTADLETIEVRVVRDPDTGEVLGHVERRDGGPWQLSNPVAAAVPTRPDPVDHPAHYTAHPSGVECITITEHMGFNLGNAVKYVWRADLKGDAVEDLRKAAWYIEREITRRGGAA